MPAACSNVLVKGGQLLVHGENKHERMLSHRYGVRSAIRADGDTCLARPLDIDAVIASAEHLDQLQTCSLRIRFIR